MTMIRVESGAKVRVDGSSAILSSRRPEHFLSTEPKNLDEAVKALIGWRAQARQIPRNRLAGLTWQTIQKALKTIVELYPDAPRELKRRRACRDRRQKKQQKAVSSS